MLVLLQPKHQTETTGECMLTCVSSLWLLAHVLNIMTVGACIGG